MVGSGLVGLHRAGSSRKWVLYMKTNFFCSLDYVPKINTKPDMRCLELQYVIAEGGSRLRATLAMIQNLT